MEKLALVCARNMHGSVAARVLNVRFHKLKHEHENLVIIYSVSFTPIVYLGAW